MTKLNANTIALFQNLNIPDMEGVVIRFDNGHMVKLKLHDYVRIHRAKDSILQEKRVVEMIVNEKVDDVLPFLIGHDQDALKSYVNDWTKGLMNTIEELWCSYTATYEHHNGDRKSFAMASQDWIHEHRATFFAIWGKTDKQEMFDYIRNFIRKNLGSKTKVDSVHWLWDNHEWANYIQVEDEDDGMGV